MSPATATSGHTVWLAIMHVFASVEVQVCSSAEAAEAWGVEQIDRTQWGPYVESLRAQGEDVPDLDTDTAPALLACWFGPPAAEADAVEYGSGLDVFLRIEKRTIR